MEFSSSRGTPQIEVTFDIDTNGISNVSAKDKATGKEQSIRIEASSGLSDDEVKMKRDAEEHEKEDSAKDIIETKNNAENLVYQTEKQLEENKDKLSKDDVNDIKSKLDDLKANESDDIEKIKKSVEDLNSSWQKVSQQMYQQAQNQQILG